VTTWLQEVQFIKADQEKIIAQYEQVGKDAQPFAV